MENITKEQEERLLLYATYSILYMNDMACFAIQQLKQRVATLDSESRKIYGALLKRERTYIENITRVVDTKMDYYCDFCSEMDNLCDSSYDDFKHALKHAYSQANITDSDLMSQIEIMRSIVELSVIGGTNIINNTAKYLPKARWLENYILNDIMRVANNFSHWVYRKIPKDISINLNEDSDVMQKFHALSEKLMSFQNFDMAYRKAIDLELERNKQ
jgi:hypothetical protein